MKLTIIAPFTDFYFINSKENKGCTNIIFYRVGVKKNDK